MCALAQIIAVGTETSAAGAPAFKPAGLEATLARVGEKLTPKFFFGLPTDVTEIFNCCLSGFVPGVNIFNITTKGGEDDAEEPLLEYKNKERASWLYNSSSDLEMCMDSSHVGPQAVGIRWPEVSICEGGLVTRATFVGTCEDDKIPPIQGEEDILITVVDAADAAPMTNDTKYPITGRDTWASTPMSAITSNRTADQEEDDVWEPFDGYQLEADVTGLVKYITAKPDWRDGNAMMMVFRSKVEDKFTDPTFIADLKGGGIPSMDRGYWKLYSTDEAIDNNVTWYAPTLVIEAACPDSPVVKPVPPAVCAKYFEQ